MPGCAIRMGELLLVLCAGSALSPERAKSTHRMLYAHVVCCCESARY